MSDEKQSIRQELATYVSDTYSLLEKNPRLNEAQVCQDCVTPLLMILGWKRDEIRREYPVGSGKKVDYALFVNERPRVLLDAKRKGANLEEYEGQILKYCTRAGVRFGILCNGETIQLFDSSVPFAESLLFSCSLKNFVDEFDDRIRYLLRGEVEKGTLRKFRQDESERNKHMEELKRNRENQFSKLEQVYKQLQSRLPEWFTVQLRERCPDIPDTVLQEFIQTQRASHSPPSTIPDVLANEISDQERKLFTGESGKWLPLYLELRQNVLSDFPGSHAYTTNEPDLRFAMGKDSGGYNRNVILVAHPRRGYLVVRIPRARFKKIRKDSPNANRNYRVTAPDQIRTILDLIRPE